MTIFVVLVLILCWNLQTDSLNMHADPLLPCLVDIRQPLEKTEIYIPRHLAAGALQAVSAALGRCLPEVWKVDVSTMHSQDGVPGWQGVESSSPTAAG